MNRYSKKREAILECVSNTKCHPTAEWVYMQIKQDYPDISLGTVYRNLNQLKRSGYLRSVGIVNGQEHFDGDISCHHHMLCGMCGSITDLEKDPDMDELIHKISKRTQFGISEIRFIGLCPECINKNK